MIHLGDVATWVAAVVAVGAAVIAIVQARKANSSAERSASAAERSAEADERLAALAEEQANAYSPPWQVNWVKGDTFELRNNSDRPEFGVTLSVPPDSHVISRFPEDPVDIDPHSAVTFLIARSMASKDASMTVNWFRTDDLEGDPLVWRTPVPRKP